MFPFLMLADAAEAGSEAVTDGLSSGNWVLVVAGGLAVAVPLVLKALGKNVPFVDPLLEAAVAAARKVQAKKAIDPAKRDAELKKIALVVKDTTEKGK